MGFFEMYVIIVTDGGKIKDFRNKATESKGCRININNIACHLSFVFIMRVI